MRGFYYSPDRSGNPFFSFVNFLKAEGKIEKKDCNVEPDGICKKRKSCGS